MMSPEQKQEVVSLFGKVRLANSLDYVSAWYVKAAEYMAGGEPHGGQTGTPSGARVVGSSQGLDHSFGLTPPSGSLTAPGRVLRAAFVSTNSICQGQQVYPIWHTLRERFGVQIDFAWPTFVWNSEAEDKAHVHVVVVGFSCGGTMGGNEHPRLFDPATGEAREVAHINAYLAPAPDAFVQAAARPISPGAPECDYGSLINDGGNYIFKPDELAEFLAKEPGAKKYVRPLIGSDELIKRRERFVLYLADADAVELSRMPHVMERVRAVAEQRAKSSAAATRKTAETPTRFYFDSTTDKPFLAIPSVSSERRRYVPMALFGPEVVATNLVSIVPGATTYHFGVLSSQFHNAWMRVVAGRLETRYRYTPKVVYNTFVWPEPTDVQRSEIERCAQAVLDAREAYAPATLAELYDPDKALVFPELTSAHAALDAAVEAAYGVDFAGDEEKIVAHLFRLYAQATGCEKD